MLKNIKTISLLQVFLGTLIFVILYWSLNKQFDHDELEVIHTSWKILQGERIYVDFFQHHHPLLYYLLVPIIVVFGESTNTLIVARLVVFCLFLLILTITYLIANKTSSREASNISLIFLCTTFIFTTNVIEIRPDVPQTLFCLLAILFLLFYFETKILSYLILSSLAISLAFLFLQKALFLILLLTILLFYHAYRKNVFYSASFAYVLVIFLVCLPYLLYLVFNDSLFAYLTLNWVLNIKFLDRNYPVDTLINMYKVNTILWFYYVLGLLSTNTFNQRFLCFISFGLLLSVFSLQKPHQQYFILLIPLVAIISSHTFYTFFLSSRKLLVVVLILATVLPCYSLFGGVAKLSNSEQLQKINYVLAVSHANDFVYDGNALFNVFRKDIDFFWYSLDEKDALDTYRSMTGYKYNIYESISKFKPKVISNYFIRDVYDERISNFYTRSSLYPDLFIRKPGS